MDTTDQQLIELVEQKTPEELTLEEIEHLRARLTDSAALRETLFAQLRMEQYLCHALGRVNVSVDSIFEQATQHQNSRRRRFAWLGLGASLLIGVGIWILSSTRDAEPEVTRAIEESAPEDADSEANEPSKSDEPTQRLPVEDDSDDKKKDKDKDKNDPDPEKDQELESTPEVPDMLDLAVGPWSAIDQLAGPRVDLAAWDTTTKSDRLTPDLLSQWLAPVEGEKSTILQSPAGKGVTIAGVFRLAAPWPADAALRIDADFKKQDQPAGDVHLYFWHNNHGVLLRPLAKYKAFTDIGAYTVEREANNVKPSSIALASLGIGKYWRIDEGRAPIDIRYQDGKLIASSAGIRLVEAPLPGPPTEVYIKGSSDIHSLHMAHTTPLPPEPTKPPQLLTEHKQPAKLNWKTSESVQDAFTKQDDGSVRLAAKAAAASQPTAAWIDATLDADQPLREWLFEVDSATAGTGLFFGDASGAKLHTFCLLTDPPSQKLHLMPVPPNANLSAAAAQSNVYPDNWLAGRYWVRLLAAGTHAQVWLSRDGVHWARCAGGMPPLAAPIATVGIYSNAATEQESREITVRQVRTRGYAALNSFAVPELLAAAVAQRAALLAAATDEQWQAVTRQTLPADARLGQWQAACAVSLFATGTPNVQVVERLLASVVDANLEPPHKLQLFDEIAVVCGSISDPAIFGRQYAQLLARELDAGNKQTFDTVGLRAWELPLGGLNQPIVLTQAARQQLITAVTEQQWTEVERLVLRIRALGNQELTHLLDWSQALASQHTGQTDDDSTSAVNYTWRHPLLTSLGKEEFNILAELEVALASNDFADACRVMVNARFSDSQGLVPAPKDEQLWVSFPVLIHRLATQYPELLRTMRDTHGDRGLLRVRGAIANGDAGVMSEITMQFFGTHAAAEAHAWLGDRALVAGEFSRAVRHFEQAKPFAPEDQLAGLAARQRLAWSMLGKSFGEPLTMPITLGDAEMSAKQFEELIAEMIEHRRREDADLVSRAATSVEPVLPEPSAFKIKKRISITPPGGAQPTNIATTARALHIDWFARRSSLVVAGESAYLQTPWSIVSIDSRSGEKVWQTDLSDTTSLLEDSWPLLPTRPAITDQHLFVRRFGRVSTELVGLDRAKGQILWTTSFAGQGEIISDPVIVAGKLVALTSDTRNRSEQLHITTFDPATGAVIARHSLITLRDSWHVHHACGLTADGNQVLASLGGTVLSSDIEGNVHWQRKQTWMPPLLDPLWLNQHAVAPLVATVDNRKLALIVQPGVPMFECIDPLTGRQIWQRVDVGVGTILGLAGSQFIVATDRGLLALDAATGNTVWSRGSNAESYAHLCGPDRMIVVEQRPTSDATKAETELVWLDTATGQIQARGATGILWDRSQPIVTGPMAYFNGSILLTAGIAPDPRSRELIQLIPSGEPAKKPEGLAASRPK